MTPPNVTDSRGAAQSVIHEAAEDVRRFRDDADGVCPGAFEGCCW